jgi:DNA polymerase III gamma/tau subunit
MSYQVLARKYRPQRFADVIGQPHVTQTLQNALQQQRIAHGYIFSGHRGIGKTTVARILAMALNCRSAERPVAEPCWRFPPMRKATPSTWRRSTPPPTAASTTPATSSTR